MSYATTYKLETNMTEEQLIQNKTNLINDLISESNLEEEEILVLMDSEIEINWNSYSSDLTKISKKFKNVLFSLYGYSEEYGDIWKKSI